MFRRLRQSIKNSFTFAASIITSNFVVETAKTAVSKSRRFLEHATFAAGTAVGFFVAGLPGAIVGAGITHALISRRKPSFQSKSLPAKLFNTGLTATGAGLGGVLGASLGVAAGPVGAFIGGAVGAATGGILTRTSINRVDRLRQFLTPSSTSRNIFIRTTETLSGFINLLTAPIRGIFKVMGCGCLFIILFTGATLLVIFASFIIPRRPATAPGGPGSLIAISCFNFEGSWNSDPKASKTYTRLDNAIKGLIEKFPNLIALACQSSHSGTITLKYSPDTVQACGWKQGDNISFNNFEDCTSNNGDTFSVWLFAHELGHIIQGGVDLLGEFLATIGSEPPMSTYGPAANDPWEDMAETIGVYTHCILFNQNCQNLGPNHRQFVEQYIGIATP